MAEALGAITGRKLGIQGGGSVLAKFSRRSGRPPPTIFAWIDRAINALQPSADGSHT